MHVLLLGAYGLIGQEIARELLARGHRVTGVARSAAKGRTLLPDLDWREADIATLTTAQAWAPLLAGIDAVVNASGALQTGARDNLGRVQRDAIVALVAAGEHAGLRKLVQISAPGATLDAATEFLRTKGEADDWVRQSALDWTILKPALVIAPTAYGGTALVRMLAAVPVVQPIALADAKVQTVSGADVARASVRALDDAALSRQTFDLAEPAPHTLLDIVLAFRRWMGFGSPSRVILVPRGVTRLLSGIADAAGWLGWRAPLRSTAVDVLADDVLADPAPWTRATGERFSTLQQTLARMPATRQERTSARQDLLFPVLVVAFALFWIASGVIGLARLESAAAIVTPRLGASLATASVVVGALADIAIGVAMLMRRWLRPACLAAVALSLVYLALGTVFTPHLWADPLGPLVKIIPVIGLALMLAAQAEER